MRAIQSPAVACCVAGVVCNCAHKGRMPGKRATAKASTRASSAKATKAICQGLSDSAEIGWRVNTTWAAACAQAAR